MNKNFFLSLIFAVAATALSLCSCADDAHTDFDRLLVQLAADDATIDSGDWSKIVAFIDAHKAKMGDFYSNGNIDAERVKTYISDMFADRRPPLQIAFTGIGQTRDLSVKFYLERSGSMTGYDSPQGDGRFKAAIVRMLNNLPGDSNSNKIYVVNSTISQYPEGFDSFIADSNIFEATKGLGDPSYTDFGAIFSSLLNKTADNELSILVTDMIYSTKNMQGVNPQKVFAEAQGMTNAAFKGAVKDKAMLIMKMQASYNGLYYPYNSPSKGIAYNGPRPYYIIIVGSNATMSRLTKDNRYSSFAQLEQLPGFQQMYLFGTSDQYHPYYSLLLRNSNIRGRFQPERGQGTQISRLKGLEADPNSGDIRLALAVDLHGMLIPDSYLCDKNNYTVSSSSPVSIQKIVPINKQDITPAEKKYIGSATHVFVLETKGISQRQDVEITLLNRLPSWVAASSSDDDTDTHTAGFANTTFGLSYLLNGIYNSYERNSDGTPRYFSMSLTLDK